MNTSVSAPSAPTLPHPLRSITGDEIVRVRATLAAAGHVVDSTRFAYVGLDEPHKREVLAGTVTDRIARVLLLDVASGASLDARVSLVSDSVLSAVAIDGSAGQIAILDEEFAAIDGILAASDEWVAALATRGIDPSSVALAPLSAGNYGFDDEQGKRIMRVLAFVQDYPEDHCWAHPVDGLCAYVDLIARRVHKLVDEKIYPVPAESGNFDDPAVVGPPLEGLKPISITQPDGPSFTVEGGELRWANWSVKLGFDTREGLVLHQLAFNDAGVERPIVYRASVSEMVVPYADPSPVRFWQNYFDTGEYLFGRYANSLEHGCDCVGDITYLDVTIADEFGNPRTIPRAVCIHEEDFGTLWKHNDLYTGSNEVRRQRRIVISFFTTVGNYDYGFYWYLYLDGTIECEAKLTGVVFTSAYPEDGSDFASELAPGLGAPYHQHLFNVRLDMTVDGTANAVDEVDVVRLPMGLGNEYGNAFTGRATRLATESEGGRVADTSVGRAWHIVNTEKRNRMGGDVGYVLIPSPAPTLLAAPESVIAQRAAYATKHLWVTQYAQNELYAAGDHVNQNPGGDGLPAYAAADRSIDGEDIVLWHTFGPTHLPRLEDWPIMPVDYARFTLKPSGFFDRNPALNVPPAVADHCAH
ncbi:primary-amine oxidase [Curtobacterium pusillum]|uniref:primary-amine oxidase n=1 Tax=Curtobacterium pusillum TaxID=69373 RepID=UPI0011A1B02E|nr:primary-amine oxidase [Curtobacterium pusillum]